LVELLDDDEMQFVFGHEIGHFLFDHYRYVSDHEGAPDLVQALQMQVRRAGEITADRIGAIAAPSLEAAVSSLIKVASGLPSTELTVNVSDVLGQVRDLDRAEGGSLDLFDTHPPIPVRIKSLLRLSNSESYCEWKGLSSTAAFTDQKMNADVARELTARYSELLTQQIHEHKKTFVMWAAILIFSADKRISRQERLAVESLAGVDRAAAALEDLTGLGRKGLEAKVRNAGALITRLGTVHVTSALDELSRVARDSASSAASAEWELIGRFLTEQG